MNQRIAPLVEWAHLTGRDIDALDRDTTVIVVSSSPLEVHGPHLPVTTDVTEAEGLLHASLAKLAPRHPEITFVHLPPLWVAADVLPQVGSIHFRASTLRRTIEDLGRSLATQGFRHIWVSNFHGGPRHVATLEVAADRVNRRHGAQMISMFSLLISRLSRDGGHDLDHVLGQLDGVDAEQLIGDIHGGFVETSMMRFLLGEHVEDPSDLPRVTLDSWRAAQGRPAGRRRNVLAEFTDSYRFFAANSYAGAPALGTAELGEQFVDTLAELTADALSELWTGQIGPSSARSPLWPWRHIVLNEALGWAFQRWSGVKSRVF